MYVYSVKAIKFCEIFPLLLTVCTLVKSKGKILKKFVAFSEYTHLTAEDNCIILKGFFLAFMILFGRTQKFISFESLCHLCNNPSIAMFLFPGTTGKSFSQLCYILGTYPIRSFLFLNLCVLRFNDNFPKDMTQLRIKGQLVSK